MKILAFTLLTALVAAIVAKHVHVPFINSTGLTVNDVPYETRVYWMKQAEEVLYKYSGPCPFRAFGTVVVNHTGGVDELICTGANNFSVSGDPTQHGEINAIQRCAREFTEKGFTPSEISLALRDLSLYTTAEPCPMCTGAIRQAGFKEFIYGTSINHLFEVGWGQILVPSHEIVAAGWPLQTTCTVIGSIGTEFTDPLFEWQYKEDTPCPKGCERVKVTEKTTTCERSSLALHVQGD